MQGCVGWLAVLNVTLVLQTLSLSQAAVWGSGSASSSAPRSGGSVWGSDASIGLWGSSVTQPAQISSNKKGKDK